MEITLYVRAKHDVFRDGKRDPRPGPGGECLRQRGMALARYFFPAEMTTGCIKRDPSGPGSVNPIGRRL